LIEEIRTSMKKRRVEICIRCSVCEQKDEQKAE